MSWLPFVILAAMLVIAFVAGRTIASERVPMQWDFKGRPTWYAPKFVAFGFLVAVGVLVVAAAALTAPPGEASWVPLLVACAVLFAQLLHLFLLRRWQAKGRAY
jgi:Protein of unknown function (DUF1648)